MTQRIDIKDILYVDMNGFTRRHTYMPVPRQSFSDCIVEINSPDVQQKATKHFINNCKTLSYRYLNLAKTL